MKTSRLATTLDSGKVSASNDHAAGLVSRMTASRDGLCSCDSQYNVRRSRCQPTRGRFAIALRSINIIHLDRYGCEVPLTISGAFMNICCM